MSLRIPEDMLAVADAAAQLDVSRRTAERYIAAGRLEAVKTHTGRVYVSKASVSQLMEPQPIKTALAAVEFPSPVADAPSGGPLVGSADAVDDEVAS